VTKDEELAAFQFVGALMHQLGIRQLRMPRETLEKVDRTVLVTVDEVRDMFIFRLGEEVTEGEPSEPSEFALPFRAVEEPE
jgi:hypothetical protein